MAARGGKGTGGSAKKTPATPTKGGKKPPMVPDTYDEKA